MDGTSACLDHVHETGVNHGLIGSSPPPRWARYTMVGSIRVHCFELTPPPPMALPWSQRIVPARVNELSQSNSSVRIRSAYTYYWKVSARSCLGGASDSAIWSFTTSP